MFWRSKKAKDSSPAHVRPRPAEGPPAEKLPQGAEAALWAILEAIPDPRNHLALTRDPTCEVRLTPAQLAYALATAPEAAAAPAPAGPAAPEPVTGAEPATAPAAAPEPVTAEAPASTPTDPAEIPLDEPIRQLPRRAGVRWSADTAEVRLPAIASAEVPSTDVHTADASVHTLEPPAPDPTRWAKGA